MEHQLNEMQKKEKRKIPSNQIGKVKIAFLKAIGFMSFALVFALLPILLGWVVTALDPAIPINLLELITSGALLIIAATISATQWLSLLFSKINPSKSLSLFSHLSLIIILIFSSIVLVAIRTMDNVDVEILKYLTYILFVFSILYSFILRTTIFFYEEIQNEYSNDIESVVAKIEEEKGIKQLLKNTHSNEIQDILVPEELETQFQKIKQKLDGQ